MIGDALQIGIWDSNKGLLLDRIDAGRNATPVAEVNRTRIITTIEVSRLSRILMLYRSDGQNDKKQQLPWCSRSQSCMPESTGQIHDVCAYGRNFRL